MKQKSTSLAHLTEEGLKIILKNYPTKIELSEIVSEIVEKTVAKSVTEIVAYELEKFGRQGDKKAQKYRDQILNREDKTLGELENIRIANNFQDHDIQNLKAKDEDHEKRILDLEDITRNKN